MESPVRGIRFIHQAIAREVADLERLADAGDRDAVAARLPFFKKVLHLHATGEEQGLFPDLAAQVPDVPATYVLDHREEDELIAAVERALPEGGPRLARAVAILREHLRLHIRKEEELLVPLVERLFSPAEQGVHVGRMMSAFSPADLAQVLPWLVTWLDPEERRAYVAIVERAMPPDRFGGMLALLRGSLAQDVWTSLGR